MDLCYIEALEGPNGNNLNYSGNVVSIGVPTSTVTNFPTLDQK